MRTTVYDVECECGEETTVAVTYWPATRTDPADGETSPEECPKCGATFVDFDKAQVWVEREPDPDIYEDDRHDRWEPRW